MSKLRFSNGVEIDTSGPLRKLKLKDGWYVVGDGMLMPANDEAEADELVEQLSSFNPTTAMFVISNKDSNPGLYWSNSLGWCDINSATIFSLNEKNSRNLPIGGEWEVLSANEHHSGSD